MVGFTGLTSLAGKHEETGKGKGSIFFLNRMLTVTHGRGK